MFCDDIPVANEEALLTRSSKAKKPMNACVHTYTKSQTPSTRRPGPGWRIHGSVEDTKLSTNKQHTLSKETQKSTKTDVYLKISDHLPDVFWGEGCDFHPKCNTSVTVVKPDFDHQMPDFDHEF